MGPESNLTGVLLTRACIQTADRGTHVEKDRVRTQQDGCHPEAKRRGLRRNQAGPHLDRGLVKLLQKKSMSGQRGRREKKGKALEQNIQEWAWTFIMSPQTSEQPMLPIVP